MAVSRQSSLAAEAVAFAEFARLFTDPLYYGIGVQGTLRLRIVR